MLIGDFIHDLRSSLDHLAQQLVLADPDSGEPGYDTQFPIMKKSRVDGGGHAVFPRIDGEISVQVAAVVDSVQPYKEPNGRYELHPLWILKHLSDTDKHKFFPLVLLTYGDVRIGTEGGVFVRPLAERVPLVAEALVTTITFAVGTEYFDVHCEVGATIDLAAGQPGGGEPVTSVLQRLLQSVRDEVVPAFDQFFD